MSAGNEGREVLYEADCPRLDLGRVAVLGFGNQGRAHALNLRDAGARVAVALREGSQSAEAVRDEGLATCSIVEASKADVVVWAVPDEVMPDAAGRLGGAKDGQLWIFLHGLAVTWGWIKPPKNVDVVLLAPQGPGAALRELFNRGGGPPAVLAIERDYTGTAKGRLLSYARQVGCARGGLLWSTFREETVVDHFGEQAVLCGGVPALVTAAWETLVEAGHDPYLSYIECLMQLKLLTELMYRNGLSGMRRMISGTALYGAVTEGEKVIGGEAGGVLKSMLRDIESGGFAERWFEASRRADWPSARDRLCGCDNAMEGVGRWVRENLRWPGIGRDER